MYSPISIAALFTSIAAESDKRLTHMQLQKLTYIAQGYKLAITGATERLINNPINAWKFGPVIPELYQELKMYGNNEIPKLYFNENIKPADQSLVRAVYDSYGSMSGVELSELTHRRGTPWDQIWNQQNGKNQQNQIISDNLIATYYLDHLIRGQSEGL
jgi:uncharacterized phage-associated protein